MKINIVVPNNHKVTALYQPWQDEVGGKQIGEVAALADRLGFHRITVGEHFMMSRDHVPVSGAHYLHATTALAYLAGHSERIRIASNVSILPLQHPIVQAKQWATLDWLSGGRADLIVGVGWLKDEFDALGVDFASRGRITDDYVEAIKEIWSSDVAEFSGAHASFEGVASEPKPISADGVPLWFAGDVPATLRRVARHGVGWSPYLTPPERIAAGIETIRSDAGYRGQKIGVFYNLANLRLSENHVAKEDTHDFDTWDAQLLIDQIEWVRELGVTEVAPPLPRLRSYQHYLERLHWLAEQVMPRVARLEEDVA